jgi:hypothetical protein
MASYDSSLKYSLEELVDHTGGWSWENKHVSQAYVNNTSGLTDKASIAIHDIIESGTVLIAAGPTDLDAAVARAGGGASTPGATSLGFRVVPIGLIETAQLSMNKPLSRIFEIGSKLSYIIPGRTVGGMSLSRVFFDGPSILKALYMGEVISDYATKDVKYAKFMSLAAQDDGYQQFANIGSGNLAMNLASTFFDQPTGLAFFFRDLKSDNVGQTYFEGCHVSTYNLGISANMNVLTESVNMEFIRCRPILTAESYGTVGENSIADVNIVSASLNAGA